MTRFHYNLRDKKNGKFFEVNQSMDADSKTEVRRELAKSWQRDVPNDARNFGFVPFRDCEIVWLEK